MCVDYVLASPRIAQADPGQWILPRGGSVTYTIICIPTKSSSNEIEDFVVIFIPLQLTLGHVVEHRRSHVCLLHDLSNGTTLSQNIVASWIFSVTKILTIEDHKLDSTFLHVAFRSQSLLKPTSDQTSFDTNWKTRKDDQKGVNES
jgi:hypothetical protein